MSKIDVLNLVSTLSNGMADPVTADKYYDQTITDLAHENWFVDARLSFFDGVGDPTMALGDDVVNLLGLIYDDVELEEASRVQMDSIDPDWRDADGYPRSYIMEDVSKKSVQLHPAADFPSNPNLGNFGEPLGQDYPTYAAAVFFSYAPLPPLQPQYYLELVIALKVLALEFTRESDHADMEFAQAAQALSDLCKGMLA